MKSELTQLKERLMKKDDFKKEFEKYDLAFEISESIIDARVAIGMTQKELAKKIKTKQSGIARLENGKLLPSLKTLEKIAKVLKLSLTNPLNNQNISGDYKILFVQAQTQIITKKQRSQENIYSFSTN